MPVRSCLILVENSKKKSPAAFAIPIPRDNDSQLFIKTVRETYLQTLTRRQRFFKTYLRFQKPVVSVATLRQIFVRDLDTLPTPYALVQSASCDEALTEALRDPSSMYWAFYRHMFDLYDDLFTEIVERDGLIALPRQVILIREEMDPVAARILGVLATIIGGIIIIAVQIAEAGQ
ncbi:metalloprotease 1 [Colletotrichum musicola]|uniref:Metalloprotease 1 n=1 Tax=Colletotrichum musicola TaxID=2175873 RepID=A0A8H6U6U6_9PEZI|nr:metalloprotease 1 [Colletotrichum musicola]